MADADRLLGLNSFVGYTMSAHKLNCWEFNGCERCPGGPGATTRGICPATVDIGFDGINGGIGAGRSCWAVAGTMAGCPAVGSFAMALGDCEACSFYQLVQEEEGEDFRPVARLSARLRSLERRLREGRASSSDNGEHHD